MRHSYRRLLLCGFAIAALLAFAAPPAVAQALPGKDKSFEVGLYLWGASVAGKVDSDQGESSAHISFSDLWDNLNFAAMLRTRAQFDKFSIVFDGEYFDLESDREQRTVRFGPRGNIEVPVSAEFEMDMWILELNGGYLLLDVAGPFAANRENRTRVEMYAGGRYYSMNPETNVHIGNNSADFGQRSTWVDGLVGMRFGIDLSRTVVLGIQGDVGGFNIGNSSDFSWSQITSLGWAFADNMNLYLGYKFLDFKRDFGDNRVKNQIRGPFLATAIRF